MDWGKESGYLPGRRTVGPLLLILLTQPFACVIAYTGLELKGDFVALGKLMMQDPIGTIRNSFYEPTWEAFYCIAIFVGFQIMLMKLAPGGESLGPVTSTGHVPKYKANGMQAYFITMFTFLGASYGLGLFDPAIAYNNFGPMITMLNYGSLILCVFLVIKAHLWPSTKDVSFSGNVMTDYYRGIELYPRVLGIDIKRLTNCRIGLMGWPVLLLSYAAKQEQLTGLSDSMFVSCCLQLVYLAKFFWWEAGYMRSIDIMHDRAGYYLCWGCCVWVPSMYTIHAFFLVEHPVHLGTPLALAILVAGWLAIFINYDADRQRVYFRATNGKAHIWGAKPGQIVAKYNTTDGKERTSLLLTSGWWGMARHFHYMPEILGAFFWSVPALFTHSMPYFYVIFLTILLVDRAGRDDQRCLDKYGKYWEEYRRRVPSRIIPGVF